MPMIEFICNNPECDNRIDKYYQQANSVPPFLDCGQCGTGKLERGLGAPSSVSTQVIDNGIQARRVEVKSHIVEQEREKIYGKK